MKAAVLTCQMADGSLKSVPEVSLIPVIEAARGVRNSGMLEGKAVVSGIVLCSWKPMPVMQFRCKSEAQKKAEADAEKAARAKARAEAKAKAEAK
jgi:hypothetical protein